MYALREALYISCVLYPGARARPHGAMQGAIKVDTEDFSLLVRKKPPFNAMLDVTIIL